MKTARIVAGLIAASFAYYGLSFYADLAEVLVSLALGVFVYLSIR